MAPGTPGIASDAARGEIRRLLEQSAAFATLPEEHRARLRADMEKVGAYLADGGWLHGTRAEGLEEQKKAVPVGDLKARMAKDPGLVDSQFKAGAVREGVAAFGDLVQKVDFPKFVSGLVKSVFQAVVDASIQQMQAFGELLSATAKTVDQFASDHVSDAQARDWLANRHPSALRVDTGGDGPARLKPVEGSEEDVGSAYGVPGADVEDEDSESQLVGAAKMEMARQRQQQLAMMVLLGINRIVVTNGHINAKVVFDMRASDEARRRSKAELHDADTQAHASFVSGFLGVVGGGSADVSEHETTVGSAVDDTSEARAAVKAQLSGDVRLAFKSETFPLERMVDVIGMQQIQDKAAPPPTRRPAAPAPAVPAAPPAAAPAAPPAGGAR